MSCELGVPVALEVAPVTVCVLVNSVALPLVSTPWSVNWGCIYLNTLVVELKSTTKPTAPDVACEIFSSAWNAPGVPLNVIDLVASKV